MALEPDEHDFLLLAELDLGHVGRVEGRHQVEDSVVEPLGDLVASEPELVLTQRGNALACPSAS